MVLPSTFQAGYPGDRARAVGTTAVSPFPARPASALPAAKVRVDSWVADITRDLFDVPHLHVTLTIDDLLWPIFHAHRSLLKVLLKTAQRITITCPALDFIYIKRVDLAVRFGAPVSRYWTGELFCPSC